MAVSSFFIINNLLIKATCLNCWQMWEALHEARQSTEHMTSRGVRIAKDVSGIVGNLVDKSICYEQQVMI